MSDAEIVEESEIVYWTNKTINIKALLSTFVFTLSELLIDSAQNLIFNSSGRLKNDLMRVQT
jgi:hypothetical protein